MTDLKLFVEWNAKATADDDEQNSRTSVAPPNEIPPSWHKLWWDLYNLRINHLRSGDTR
jgi:hypothetical protein